MALRVVVAEDVLIVREGVLRMLGYQDDVEVVAAVEDLPTLLAAVDEHGPDVVLTDIRMPPTGTDEGIQAALTLRDSHPALGVVVLSQHVDANWALDLFARGSERRAYLLKERVSEPGQLVAAIREVAAGGSVVDPKVVESLLASRTHKRSALDELTQREREVLGEIAQGKNNAERQLSLTIMRGDAKPRVRKLKEGALLTEQGAPGDELYLVLDGVLRVEVDGTVVAEVGPGAVLGERAILEGGNRTSTLRTVTACRIAVATTQQIDHHALRELSEGHRREEEATPA